MKKYYIAAGIIAILWVYYLQIDHKAPRLNEPEPTLAKIPSPATDTIKSIKALGQNPINKQPKPVTEVRTINNQNHQDTPLPTLKAIEQVIDGLSSYELEGYFEKFFAHNSEAFNSIANKSTLAKNLASEFLNDDIENNSQTDGYSSVYFSLSENYNNTVINHFTLAEQASKTIYAHLILRSAINNNAQVFVKWIALDTGKVLLFDQKNINPISQHNWVSFTPSNSWQAGQYLVKFYQFESSLDLIAQNTYSIY